MLFGNRIRELRDKQGVLQRQLAALLEIDTPMFSKIERGDRRAKRAYSGGYPFSISGDIRSLPS